MSDVEEGFPTEGSLYSLLERTEKRYGEKTAMQIKLNDSYQEYSYASFMDQSRALAMRLREMGVEKGSHVGLWGESRPEWTIAYWGIHFSGAVVVPLDPQLPASSVENLLGFSQAKILICSPDLWEQAVAWKEDLNVLSWGQEPSIFSWPGEKIEFSPPDVEEDDAMSLIFTSGTTGDPKGVVLTGKNFLMNARGAVEVCEGTEKDVFLCILPLHHCYAFTSHVVGAMILGATVTYQTVLQGPAIMESLQETRVTFMQGVPQLFALFDQGIWRKISSQPWPKRMVFRFLFSISRIARKSLELNLGKVFFGQIHERFGPDFRFFMSGGARLDPKIAERFWDLGIPMVEGYGLTETAPVITLTSPHRFSPASVGKPISGVEVKIDKPSEEGVGEIIMRGPTLMKGYYQNEKATKEVVREGWFYTGDLGYIDKQGQLYVTGRAKEVIVLASGKNIYPEDVEREYELAPTIGEVCVFGESQSDRLSALLVPDFEEIKRRKVPSIKGEIKFQVEQVSLRLPSYMRLNSFRVVSEPFPRTSLGKLRRTIIAKEKVVELEEDNTPPPLSPEDSQLLEKPKVDLLFQRLENLTGYEAEIFPSDSIELDLGLESIQYMELLTILRQDFACDFPATATPVFTHVRDILAILPRDQEKTEIKTSGPSFSWKALLQEKCSPSLEEMFNLKRHVGQRWAVNVLRVSSRLFLKPFFGGKNRGFSNLSKQSGPIILAPTHQSYLDPIMLYSFLPGRLLDNTIFTAMDTIFSKWPFSRFVRILRIIKTASAETSLSSMQYIGQALEKKHAVCIFPEGLRSSDGSVRKPLIGMGVLACECQAPVYPVRIDGAIKAFSRPNPGFHFCKTKFTVLDPIIPPQKENFSEEDYQSIVDRWYQAVTKSQEEKI